MWRYIGLLNTHVIYYHIIIWTQAVVQKEAIISLLLNRVLTIWLFIGRQEQMFHVSSWNTDNEPSHWRLIYDTAASNVQ